MNIYEKQKLKEKQDELLEVLKDESLELENVYNRMLALAKEPNISKETLIRIYNINLQKLYKETMIDFNEVLVSDSKSEVKRHVGRPSKFNEEYKDYVVKCYKSKKSISGVVAYINSLENGESIEYHAVRRILKERGLI